MPPTQPGPLPQPNVLLPTTRPPHASALGRAGTHRTEKQESKRNLCPGPPSAGTAARGHPNSTARLPGARLLCKLESCPPPSSWLPHPWLHPPQGPVRPRPEPDTTFPGGVRGAQSRAASLPRPGEGALQRLPPLPSPLGAGWAHRGPSHGVKALVYPYRSTWDAPEQPHLQRELQNRASPEDESHPEGLQPCPYLQQPPALVPPFPRSPGGLLGTGECPRRQGQPR